MIWKIGDPERVAIRFSDAAAASQPSPGRVRFLDIFGNPVQHGAIGTAAATLAVSESPVFFEGGTLDTVR